MTKELYLIGSEESVLHNWTTKHTVQLIGDSLIYILAIICCNLKKVFIKSNIPDLDYIMTMKLYEKQATCKSSSSSSWLVLIVSWDAQGVNQ